MVHMVAMDPEAARPSTGLRCGGKCGLAPEERGERDGPERAEDRDAHADEEQLKCKHCSTRVVVGKEALHRRSLVYRPLIQLRPLRSAREI